MIAHIIKEPLEVCGYDFKNENSQHNYFFRVLVLTGE